MTSQFLYTWLTVFAAIIPTAAIGHILDPNFNKAYYYRYELRTAPVALLARWQTLDASYRINRHWATGPALVAYNSEGRGGMLAPSFKGLAIGWHVTHYFLSVARHGWYSGLHAYHEDYESRGHGDDGYEKLEGLRTNLVLGHHWRWNRVNLMVGAGPELKNYKVAKYDRGNSTPTISHESNLGPTVELKLGLEI